MTTTSMIYVAPQFSGELYTAAELTSMAQRLFDEVESFAEQSKWVGCANLTLLRQYTLEAEQHISDVKQGFDLLKEASVSFSLADTSMWIAIENAAAILGKTGVKAHETLLNVRIQTAGAVHINHHDFLCDREEAVDEKDQGVALFLSAPNQIWSNIAHREELEVPKFRSKPWVG